MNKTTLADCQELLRNIYNHARDEYVLYMISSPGMGKTETVHQLADELGVNVYEIVASQCDPIEISGMTMPDKDTRQMVIYDNETLRKLKDGDILFLDEFDKSQPEVQAAILKLLQERTLRSGRKLPNCMIVAAGNDDIQYPERISEAVRERFLYIHLEFDFKEWAKFVKDTLNVIPSRAWEPVINSFNEEWNNMTPRDVYKLIKMYKNTGKDSKMLNNLVESAYKDSYLIVRALTDQVKNPCDEIIMHIVDNKIVDLADGSPKDRDLQRSLQNLSHHLQLTETSKWLEMIKIFDAEWEGTYSLLDAIREESEHYE